MLRRRMPIHPSPSGDGAQVGLPGVEHHIFPNLLLLFGELLRRGDSPYLIQKQLPLRLHLPDQRVQLLLALRPRLRIDIFGVPLAVRPGGGVAALKQVVVDLGDAPGAGPADPAFHGLKVGHQRSIWRLHLLHLVAQPAVNPGRRLSLHRIGDMGVDVQRGGRRHVAQHGGESLHVHSVLQG